MALVLADRVRETTTVTGTGTATLLGAAPGYQSFSAVGNSNTTYYVIANQSATEWEVGIGTYTASGTLLSRDTVLSSSNSGSLVNFSAGTKDVFVDYPASKAVYEDAAGNVDGYPITGGTINNTTVGATTPSTGVFTTLTANTTFQFGASSANYGEGTGGATTKAVEFKTLGSDTNVAYAIRTKGTGAIDLAAGSSGVNISNGGTVTAITRTASGSSYTSAPALAITAPTTAGGVQATATCTIGASSATVVSGGTGYTLNDVITISGGTFGIAAVGNASAVSGGVVTAITLTGFGSYTAFPSSPASTTGGTGTGLTVTLGGGFINTAFTITNAGSGYVEQPTVTFSGGGGSSAAAYATVGAEPTIKSLFGSTTAGLAFSTPFGAQMRLLDIGDGTRPLVINGGSAGGAQIPGISVPAVLGISAGGGNPVNFYTNGRVTTQQFQVSHTASAVNYVQVTGSATGAAPTISAQGSDTNIPLTLNSKGNNGIIFQTRGAGTPRIALQLLDSGSASVNYLQIQSNISGAGPVLSALGTDTNIDLNLTPKGTGTVVANGPFTATGQTSLGTGSTRFWTASGASTTPTFIASGNNAIFGVAGTGTTFIQSSTSTSQLAVAHTASAVNYVQVTGGSTGNAPYFISQGSDTNVNLWYGTKGTGYHAFFTAGNGANVQFLIANTASAVNYVQTSGSTTGFGAKIFSAGSDTNIPLVLQPKGTGALQAQQTDSTATGGNARGANAVDWQTSRDTAAKVASGQYSVIGGGNSNRATSYSSALVGGLNNNSSGGYSFLGGGLENGSTSSYSFLGGGFRNSAAGPYNFVGGGYSNVATSGSVVTTQSATMNGTTAVTLSGANASIKVGQYIGGTYISAYPNDTYVAAISGTSLTLSQAASGSGTATLSFYTPHGVVVGGGNNQATGSYSFIGGGGDAGTAANRNVASGDWSTVGGGAKNVASGVGSFIGGGGFDGGFGGNTASGSGSAIAGGLVNQATGNGAFVGGGYSNIANSSKSAILGGYYGTTRSIDGMQAAAACTVPIGYVSGITQSGLLILATETTNATATVLRSNPNAAGTTNQVILPNNSAYAFRGTVIANVTGGGNTKAWAIEGAIKRGANAASTALVGTPTVTSGFADAGASTWAIAVTADTTNGGLAITFTGQAATTIRCVAKLETTEVTF